MALTALQLPRAQLCEPAQYHDSDRTGYFSLLWRPHGTDRKKQWCYPLEAMWGVLEDYDLSLDTWISQGEFDAPTRRFVNFSRISLAFCDLDTYKIGIKGSPERRTERLLRLCEKVGLPEPSLVIFSGRGLQVKWLFGSPVPRMALPRWNLVQREITYRLRSMGADSNSIDASRVLRLVDTTHSTSGCTVRVVHHNPTKLWFDEFADAVLPLTRAELSRRREARKNGQPFNVAQVESKRAVTRTKGHLTLINTASLGNRRPFLPQKLAADRFEDLLTLVELRWKNGAPDGCRDPAVFIGSTLLAQAYPNLPKFNLELQALAKKVAPHWNDDKIRSVTGAVVRRMQAYGRGEKVKDNNDVECDPRYRWKTETLIHRLEITPEEERRLHTIISATEVRRRGALRKETARRDAGVPTRAEWLESAEQKRVSARLMRAQGKSWAEVAAVLGYANGETARVAVRSSGP